MSTVELIPTQLLKRKAVVYVRQSTPSGPVTLWCRSFDYVMCSKGDEPWAQTGRMNFARMRCGSR
jgi:hypothetical protein